MNNLVTTVGAKLLIADLVAGALSAAKVGLFIGGLVPTQTTLYGDISASPNLPTYTGYAEQNAVFTAGDQNAGGTYTTHSALLTFKPSGGTPTDTITGYYVSDGGTPQKLLAAARFDTPIPLVSADTAVLVVAEVEIPVTGWGSPALIG